MSATESAYCLLHRHTLPDRFPVQPRRNLATRRPSVVATRDGQRLLCGLEHDGPCLWPDGEEALAARVETLANGGVDPRKRVSPTEIE